MTRCKNFFCTAGLDFLCITCKYNESRAQNKQVYLFLYRMCFFVFGKFKYMKIYAGDDRVVEKSTLCFPPEVIFGVFYFDGQLSLSLFLRGNLSLMRGVAVRPAYVGRVLRQPYSVFFSVQ